MIKQNDLPIVVAFTGYSGDGKDTWMQFFEQYIRKVKPLGLKLNCHHQSFAKPVKEVIKYVYSLSDEDVYGTNDRRARERPHINLNDHTPRYAMQQIATEGFRKLIDENTWTKHWLRERYAEADRNDVLILTDLRFLNEVKFLQVNCPNLLIFRVERRPVSKWQHWINKYDVFNLSRKRWHQSEREVKVVEDWLLDNCPHALSYIDNTGPLPTQEEAFKKFADFPAMLLMCGFTKNTKTT